MIPLVLAHGALGSFDELLFLAVAVVFVALMVIAWIRSRNSSVDEEGEAAEGSIPTAASEPPLNSRPDHFPLA
ncbi:MAG TPA: hypothetical protein VER79_01805 [Candidatus Limnocylindrales bacterium]|nr:hypothetical protein [Candidatus Limnocylindrales bacterium]